jgi:L-proline amide hydrolase
MEEILLRHEEQGTIDDPEYQKVHQEFREKYTCRTLPWPKELTDAFAMVGEDPTVVRNM